LEYPKGDPREPMTINDLSNKFNSLSAKLLSRDKQEKIKDTIFNCENISAQEFMKGLIV